MQKICAAYWYISEIKHAIREDMVPYTQEHFTSAYGMEDLGTHRPTQLALFASLRHRPSGNPV